MGNTPVTKQKLRLWLQSGYMEKGMFNPTTAGTPQGGIISPVLANMTLDGMEELLENKFRKNRKVHMNRYADDFINTGESKELLENEVKPLVMEFLKPRGLELSEEKTKISHIDDGFDFLGFNIRKYKGKLLIKPSKSSISSVKEKISEIIRANKTAKTEELIKRLNPVIRGWGIFYSHSCSKETFCKIDHAIWGMTWRWAKRRHPKKSRTWIKSKYYQRVGERNWVFQEKGKETKLVKMSSIPIRRHIKIKGEANPYDSTWHQYFKERAMKNQKRKPGTKQGKLWIRQEGNCPECHTELDKEEQWHIHHLIPRNEGGKDSVENLALVHETCHRQIHC